jgi:hypothetical protein
LIFVHLIGKGPANLIGTPKNCDLRLATRPSAVMETLCDTLSLEDCIRFKDVYCGRNNSVVKKDSWGIRSVLSASRRGVNVHAIIVPKLLQFLRDKWPLFLDGLRNPESYLIERSFMTFFGGEPNQERIRLKPHADGAPEDGVFTLVYILYACKGEVILHDAGAEQYGGYIEFSSQPNGLLVPEPRAHARNTAAGRTSKKNPDKLPNRFSSRQRYYPRSNSTYAFLGGHVNHLVSSVDDPTVTRFVYAVFLPLGRKSACWNTEIIKWVNHCSRGGSSNGTPYVDFCRECFRRFTRPIEPIEGEKLCGRCLNC